MTWLTKINEKLSGVEKMALLVVAIGTAGMTLKAMYDDSRTDAMVETLTHRLKPVQLPEYKFDRHTDSLYIVGLENYLIRKHARQDSINSEILKSVRLLQSDMREVKTLVRVQQSTTKYEGFDAVLQSIEQLKKVDSIRTQAQIENEQRLLNAADELRSINRQLMQQPKYDRIK